MKKVMKSFMAMALGLSLVLTGCSDDDDDSNLSAFTGTYPVEVDVKLGDVPVISGLEVNLILSEEGGNFKASATLPQYGSIDIVLSSLSSNLPNMGVGVTDLSGYLFKVAEQTVNVSGDVKIKGSAVEEYKGYAGYVVKGKVEGVERKGIYIVLEGVDVPGGLVIEIEG
jgi:hypothetical protein